MTRSGAAEKKADAHVRLEEPVLAVEDFAIAIHMAARGVTARRQKRIASQRDHADSSGPTKESISQLPAYERDMLSYAYRDAAPFYTTKLTPSELPRDGLVKIGFPGGGTWYRAEDENLLSVSDRSPHRTVSLHAAITDFVAFPISILHLVFRPLPVVSESRNSPESELDEYDLIKLVKLWEGGEGQPVPGSETEQTKAAKKQIPHFFIEGDEVLSLDGLFDKMFKDEGDFAMQAQHGAQHAGHARNSGRHRDGRPVARRGRYEGSLVLQRVTVDQRKKSGSVRG